MRLAGLSVSIGSMFKYICMYIYIYMFIYSFIYLNLYIYIQTHIIYIWNVQMTKWHHPPQLKPSLTHWSGSIGLETPCGSMIFMHLQGEIPWSRKKNGVKQTPKKPQECPFNYTAICRCYFTPFITGSGDFTTNLGPSHHATKAGHCKDVIHHCIVIAMEKSSAWDTVYQRMSRDGS